MAEEDIIFGKNRHFFGGLEPSNMRKFEVYIEDGMVKIDAHLPADTVIDGQTLCTVKGASIRRKVSEYPRDEFDGEEIANIVSDLTFIDDTADISGTYYYRAFPYTTKGVYNRNAVNKAVINEPDPMVTFSAKSVYDSATDSFSVELVVDIPDTAVGAIIRRSVIGYPVTENDGDECMTVNSDGVYRDTNVASGIRYYYSAFPYTVNGACSREGDNRVEVGTFKYTYLYGYDLDTNDPDPDTRVSYPVGVDNYIYTPAFMDFTAGSFNYGSWPNTPGDKFMPKPCVLNYNGTVAYYLDPNDYTKRADGSTSSGITSLSGCAPMMEWPKIYTKRWEDENGIYHFRCSDAQVDDDWDCWCNYDKNNNVVDHFYMSIYPATNIGSSGVACVSGGNPANTNVTSAMSDYSQHCGENWSYWYAAEAFLIQDLLVMMAKSTDAQTKYGYGIYGGPPANGKTDTRGLFYGTSTGGSSSTVKVFGIEHFWGLDSYLCGLLYINNAYKFKATPGTHDGSSVTGFNFDTGNGYITLAEGLFANGSSAYISDMKTTTFGRAPIALNGSATTYETDMTSVNSSNGTSSNPLVASLGGKSTDGTGCGPFSLNFTAIRSTTGSWVHRLSYRPVAN